jgi:predicted nucleic acid-binding Zn ribbon protein
VATPPRSCEWCRSQFIPYRATSRACSTPCRTALNRHDTAARRRKNRRQEACIVCSRPFTAIRTDTRYCSSSCTRRDWSRRNPARYQTIKAAARVRRHYRLATSPGVSPRDWQRTLNRFQGRCAYCNNPTPLPHMDHVIPLARGGLHQIGNVLPACPDCNMHKGSKLLAVWRATPIATRSEATK